MCRCRRFPVHSYAGCMHCAITRRSSLEPFLSCKTKLSTTLVSVVCGSGRTQIPRLLASTGQGWTREASLRPAHHPLRPLRYDKPDMKSTQLAALCCPSKCLPHCALSEWTFVDTDPRCAACLLCYMAISTCVRIHKGDVEVERR